TQTVPLQVKIAITNLLKQVPGINNAYLNRPQPVGENEGAVIILREDVHNNRQDNQTTQSLTLQLRISIHLPVFVGGEPLDVVADPYWQAVHTVMTGTVRQLPGVQGVLYRQGQPEAEGDAGRLDLVYDVRVRTYQQNLAQVVP
ncbi:MAG: hypothetical protein ACK587_02705, partial [Cyanobacteriota bacterium]